MAYIRRLPSGRWQATVRGPDGRRHTETDALKSVVKRWAAQQEAAVARGDFRDPRLGEMKIGDWHKRWMAARSPGTATAAKMASLWRTHCEAEWARWPMAAVSRMEAQEWAKRLSTTRVARWRGRAVTEADEDVPLLSAESVSAAVHLMSSLYAEAMRENPPLVLVNPFSSLELPEIPPHSIDFLEPAEAEALYAAAESLFGPKWRTLIELGTEVGLRPGELYGLHGHRVDWIRGQITVVDVMTRAGLRQWPKSRKSHRVVPAEPHIKGMSVLMAGRSRDSLVFTASEGGPITDTAFRNRIWNPAVRAAGIRRFPPRIMRHTAASWLVLDGVPLYDVQALLGHESYATTERYAHLRPDAYDKITESWQRRRHPDAPLTHEQKGRRSR